jgi:hypothetical protein
MRKVWVVSFFLLTLFIMAEEVSAQGRLWLTAARGSSTVTLGYLKKSVKIDLDAELHGANGTLPGNEPHRYTVLFTIEKQGFLYMVAKVCSASPISNPMAACGGDRPCAILWIKTDKMLKKQEVQSEIYASCSYNYYDSKVKLTKTGLNIEFGGREKKRMIYDNADAEKGLVIVGGGPVS